MGRTRRGRLRVLVHELGRHYPDADRLIASGRVLVDGRPVTNPRSLVRAGASIVVEQERQLRGEVKLRAALAEFDFDVDGRTCLDVGAAAGGFTRALLDAGARRVYAVDVGHGQLLGSLRNDSRVVNLERTNLADLGRELVPERLDVVTMDLSYLSVAAAVPQLGSLTIRPGATLIGLVKPMFELGLPAPPDDPERAVPVAARALERAGWRVIGTMRSPVTGARGAVEFLVYAERVMRT